MSGLYAEGDWDSQVADDSLNHFLQSVILSCVLEAVEHFSKDDAVDGIEMSAEFQLHQHAIDLKGLGGDVLEKQNGTGSFDRVGRTQGRDQDRKTPAVQDAFGFTLGERNDFGIQRNIPRRGAG